MLEVALDILWHLRFQLGRISLFDWQCELKHLILWSCRALQLQRLELGQLRKWEREKWDGSISWGSGNVCPQASHGPPSQLEVAFDILWHLRFQLGRISLFDWQCELKHLILWSCRALQLQRLELGQLRKWEREKWDIYIYIFIFIFIDVCFCFFLVFVWSPFLFHGTFGKRSGLITDKTWKNRNSIAFEQTGFQGSWRLKQWT